MMRKHYGKMLDGAQGARPNGILVAGCLRLRAKELKSSVFRRHFYVLLYMIYFTLATISLFPLHGALLLLLLLSWIAMRASVL